MLSHDPRPRARADADAMRARIARRLQRYAPAVQAAVQETARGHPRVADLALSFPALLFALAVPRREADAARATAAAIEGRALCRRGASRGRADVAAQAAGRRADETASASSRRRSLPPAHRQSPAAFAEARAGLARDRGVRGAMGARAVRDLDRARADARAERHQARSAQAALPLGLVLAAARHGRASADRQAVAAGAALQDGARRRLRVARARRPAHQSWRGADRRPMADARLHAQLPIHPVAQRRRDRGGSGRDEELPEYLRLQSRA